MEAQSDLERFIGYARAFEVAQAADAWELLEPCFGADAVDCVHSGGSLGGDDRGRDAVLAGLRRSVLHHDRRFDVRIPEILRLRGAEAGKRAGAGHCAGRLPATCDPVMCRGDDFCRAVPPHRASRCHSLSTTLFREA